MIALRKQILLLFLLFISINVFSVSIFVESPIPQGVSWSFSVDLGSLQNVDSAKVFVGNELAIEIFEFSGTKYANESSISSKVLDYSIKGNILTVSYSAKSESTIEVSVKTYSGDVEQSSDYETVEFFIPMDQATKRDLESQINNLKSTVDSQNSTISDLQSKLITKDNEIEYLRNQNSSLLNSINNMQLMIETLEAGGKTTEEQLLVLKSDLNTIIVEQEEAKRNNPINAFFAFNESTNGLAIGAGLVFVLLIIVAIVLRNSGDSIYSGFTLPKIENPFKKEESGLGGEVQESNESKEDDIDEQADEMFRGKWAFIDEDDKK